MRATNNGSSVWLTHSKNDIGMVSIGVRLLDDKNHILSLDWERIRLCRQLRLGEALIQEININFPR